MPKFSSRSLAKIQTCDLKIQAVFMVVINHFDCTPIYGGRSPEKQMSLYKKGRELVNDRWIIKDKRKIVTYKDGIIRKSKHNYTPSQAIDIVPYYGISPHIRWRDTDRMRYFAGYVMLVAKMLGVPLVWGGDWDSDTEVRDQTFMDLAHYELA